RKLTDRGLRDNVTIHQDDTRPAKVHEETKNVIEQYFGTEPEEQTGRPDVIVLEVIDEAADEYDYLITEVKNSTHQDTIRQGVKETLEYLAFLHIDDSGDETDYVFEQDNMFGSGYNGVLVVQDLEQDAKAIEEQEEQSIKILQAGELKDGYGPLRDVVEEII
ncbi:MAG: hypothetical protein SV186_07215, partial [Candidatus Nanohaloarchaea archaeon]|nr:hypothetical protein [Candidatus Nanohaloarchaea archaeon]